MDKPRLLWPMMAKELMRADVRKRAIRGLLRGIAIGIVLVFFATALYACAHASPTDRARTFGVVQKTAVDGLGKAYLDYCEIIRRPQCIEADKAAAESGTPQTKADRVACLRPCDSATATRVQEAVDLVRTEQTVLFEAIKGGSMTEEELAAQRAQLRRAADLLMQLLEESGVLDELGSAVEGIGR